MVFSISQIGTIILYDNKSQNNRNQFKQKLVIGEVVKLSVTSIRFIAGRSRLHSKQDRDVENRKNTQGGNSSVDYSASLEGQSNERGPVLRQLATWLLQVQ